VKYISWISSGMFLMFLALSGCHWGVRPIEDLVDIPRITKEQLRQMQQNPKTVVIDVRYTPNWKKSDIKILHAVREDPMELGSWVSRYPKDQTLILYCD